MTAHRQTLTDTPFPDDDGDADPAIRALLAAAADGDPVAYLRAVAGLCAARLLVPVVATRSAQGVVADGTRDISDGAAPGGPSMATKATDGVVSDKEAEMAVALLETQDGRRGLAVFTGLDTLTGWNAAARPVPVTLDLAAGSARQDSAEALLVDVDGPYPLVISGDVLTQLAAGHRLIEVESGQFGWVMPDRAG